EPPRLIGILRPLRQLTQSRGAVIPANPNRRRHSKPPPVCHGESYSRRFVNLEASVRSRDTGVGRRRDRDLIEAGLSEPAGWGVGLWGLCRWQLVREPP